ncbi:MAG: transporter [bacterium]
MSGFGGRSRGRAALLGALGACLASPALAEDRFELENFRPMPNQGDHFLSNMSARPTPHGQWTLELFGSFADDPLVAVSAATDKRLGSIVSTQIVGRLLGSISLWDRFELGLDVPVIASQDGDKPIPGLADSELPNHDLGIGDVRLVPRLTLFSTETATDPSGFSIALAAATFLPTGNAENYQGDGGVRVEPRLALDYALKSGVRLNANVGYMLRPEHTAFRNLQVSDELTWGAALDLPLGTPKVHLVPEVFGGAALEGDSIDAEEMPIEVVAGLKILPTESFIITLGGGAGVVQGFGTPDYRAFFGLSYRHKPDSDPDGDGILGDADQCPDEAEDKDGFEDSNGCPDLDNDQDGIADTADQCPNEAEDKDAFEDENGCPDPDNDNDGIEDGADQCPLEAEDKDGFEDENGCPDNDNDGDGLSDKDDKCPMNPEDKDDFQDHDGCPDPDNDNDGIVDGEDKCPSSPRPSTAWMIRTAAPTRAARSS